MIDDRQKKSINLVLRCENKVYLESVEYLKAKFKNKLGVETLSTSGKDNLDLVLEILNDVSAPETAEAWIHFLDNLNNKINVIRPKLKNRNSN